MPKISEALAEIKRTEGELMRLWELRDVIIQEQNQFLSNNTISPDEFATIQAKYLEEKSKKVTEINEQLSQLIGRIVHNKVLVNRQNIANGIDEKLQTIKYIRIELSKLMKFVQAGKHSYIHHNLDTETRIALNIDDQIKLLEKQKAALDAEIQSSNWTNEIA